MDRYEAARAARDWFDGASGLSLDKGFNIVDTTQFDFKEWEGFAKDNPYCPAFNETCCESNRDKYDRKCFLCGKDESENITSTDKHRKLSVHHYDMDKISGCDNHRWKLVPLCMKCHGGAHNSLTTSRIIYLLENVWNKE